MITKRRGALALLVATGGIAVAQTPPPPEYPNPPTPSPDPMNPTTEPIPETTAPPIPDPLPPDTSTDETITGDPTYSIQNRRRTTTTTEDRSLLFTDYGFALSAGGGVSGFTSDTARSATDAGGGWDVRATIGTRLPVAGEISYLGSAQSINALGLDDGAVLMGNGVQGNLRLNLMAGAALQPFVYGGVAWRRYDLTNTDTNTSDVNENDDVVEFPVGAGLAYRYRGFILDARGEFRAATNEDLMPSLTTSSAAVNDAQASLHRWGVNANIGYEF